MDPNNTEAFMELERLGELLKRLPEPEWYKTNPSGTAKEERRSPGAAVSCSKAGASPGNVPCNPAVAAVLPLEESTVWDTSWHRCMC